MIRLHHLKGLRGLEEKKILEQLSRPRFLRVSKFPALFSLLNRWKKGREISKPGKDRGLESCSNIFFPLVHCIIVFWN